jgi:transcriptional regulator GlxA family with amidase domain
MAAAPVAAAPPEDASNPVASVAQPPQKKTRTLGIVLYPRFELLDVYGPAEIFGNVGGRLKIVMVAEKAGPVASVQGPKVIADQGPKVNWIRKARWVDDGDRVTSSGVSAGMDMALHVVGRLFGTNVAETIADGTEYQWHRDADNDPFYKPPAAK